jgi:hypothetical protein
MIWRHTADAAVWRSINGLGPVALSRNAVSRYKRNDINVNNENAIGQKDGPLLKHH